MKTLTIGILIIFCIFVMLVSIYSEVKDYNRIQQSTIDGLKKQLKTQEDSLQNVLSVTRDSLTIAFETIKQANIERQAAHERSQKTIKDLQRIVYIKYESDSARLNALKTLYPSWK